MCAVYVSYVSKKISKIRWRPILKSNLQHEKANVFAAGSCDDEDNSVSIWSYPSRSDSKDGEDDNVAALDNSDPEMITEISHKGDVMDLKFCANDILVSASSNGSVNLYKFQGQNLQPNHSWDRVHEYATRGAPCSAVDSKSDEICTVGEDGRLALLSIYKKQVVWKKEIESCSLSAICYLRQLEVAVSNIRGQLKIFDLRSKIHKASLTVSHDDPCGISCLGQHPSQAHLLVSGSEDGSLYMWDMRQERSPVATLTTHQGAVMEAKFHPTNPDLLFTCSLDGSLLQWDASKVAQQSAPMQHSAARTLRGTGLENHKPLYSGSSNPWLNCDAVKHKLDIVSLLMPLTVPVVSLDVEDETLLCSADNEAIYSVTGITT